MRITKKIISLLLVLSMVASFAAMTGFEASANLQNQQKTDFGIHFDDTTRKLKVLQLPDIQTSVSGGSITERTRETIRLLMQRYNPDVILLTGDQTQGGSTSTKAQWESAINRAYNTFSPYMKSTCKVIAVPGNHEYDFGSLNHQWEYQADRYSYFVDWDNNFSTIDLDGAPGAGNITVSASSTNKAVALNFAMFNSKGDEDEGYLRPGGDNETAYNQLVQWYTQMNNTLASSQYSYKAQVTGQASAYVPTLAAQHVILQEIYTTGALIAGDASNGVPTPGRYTHVTNWPYVRLDPANNPSGAMNEGPCPTWLYNGATRALYDALNNPGNCLGMTFGHDHDNYFDVVDDNGFRFIMGGALTQENYNTDQNPKGRYFEFTLDDATGEVDMTTEVKSYTQLSITGSADVTSDRIEVINGDGIQLVNTLSVPKTIYIGSSENLADVRAKQEFGNVVQTQLLDYKTKTPYDQDLAVSYCLPASATNVSFSAHRTVGNAQATLTNLGTETTSEGVLYKYAIKGESVLTAGEHIDYTVTYTYNGVEYVIRNASVVENIKQPAGYNDWFRGYRESNNSKHYVDLAYVATLSGAGAYSVSRETSQNSGEFNSNTYYNYSLMIADVDQSWYNKAGDTRFSMFRFSPSRREVTGGLVSQRAIYAPPRTDIYLDASAMQKVSTTDSRLDTGVSIDFWIQKDLDRGFVEYISGIGFYAGDQDFNPSGATIDWDGNVRYDNYNTAISAENDSTGSGGTIDEAKIFFYDTFAHQQSLYGLGTTHVNGNLLPENKLGNMAGQYKGYPLVVDSKDAALALNGKDMTMFTGVRNKGSSDGGYRILLYAVSPYYLNFHTYDKGALRELTMSELMNPRKKSDYPNATQQMWDAYMSAYQNALNCYAQIQTTQADINNFNTALQNAIAALLNSNKGKPDDSLLLQGKSQFASIDVPPIIYVSGSTIQTAAPYTDRVVKYDVPSGATNVSCIVVNAGNDNVNSAVTTSTTQSGTHYETTVTGGTASAGGSIYYKLSYTLPQDLNKDGKNDTYTQYAASYVKGVPNTEGMWISRTRRSRSLISRNTRIHVKASVTMDNNILGSRGVSGIMALYGGVQGTSFHTTVVNGTTNEYTRYGDESVYWAVGTAAQWPRASGHGAAGRVLFFNDRAQAKFNSGNPYWNGLKNYSTDSTINTGGNNSDEYVVAHIYFDPQATGASVKPRFKFVMTTPDSDGNGPTMYKYWDANNYTGVNYSGDYVNKSPDVATTGMFTLASTGANNSWANGNSITLNNGAVWEMYMDANKSLNQFTAAATYSRLLIHGEKKDSEWNNSIVGFAFVFNRVNRSKAHEAIDWITGKVPVSPSAVFNEADMDPAWWSQWRTQVMTAYTKCGNLWDTEDFNQDLLVNLWQNPVYKDADYSKLVNTLKNIAGSAVVNESIANYDALTFAISSGDDQRYAGTRYAKDMFINNAADLIATIKNRTTVYAETDSTLKATSDSAGNLHDAHLDVRFQKYINDYADALQQSWDKLRLAPADYTAFDKYSNYYSAENDTITFMRDEYAGYHNDGTAKNYANEKALASGMYTYSTYTAFKNSLNIDRTLKKPSENAVVGSLPRLYPQNFTYKNVASPDVPDTTNCLYNTARDAYEALEFRKAGEYYSADGSYTEGGVTYYANYNKQDRGASYLYTPVFKTSYNSLSADIVNAGFVVTDAKVKPTYTAGNSGDTNGNGKYDAGEIWVTNGAGEYIKTINPWTDASWGDVGYGFADAYEKQINDSSSTYQSTKNQADWILALFVERDILPDIADVDYYYEKLTPASYDMSQLEIQKTTPATYESGSTDYNALAGYIIYDENGNVLTDGAQWYTADTWTEYFTAKNAQPGIIDGATLAENQNAINALTQAIYQKRAALVLRTMEDYRVSEENAILGKTDFASINAEAERYYNIVNNRKVQVFSLRADDPASYAAVAGNDPLFKDHPYFTEAYITTLGGLLENDAKTGIKNFAGKPMATSIAAYTDAVNAFMAKYNESTDPANINKANTSTLQLLLNKTWIPEYDKYGSGNYNAGKWLLGEEFDGSDWYSNWEQYDTARKNALKFFNATDYDGEKVAVNLTHYGNQVPAGDFYVNVQGAQFTVDKDPNSPTYSQPIAVDGTSLEGTVNKVAYDLVVAYYRLQHKKVSDYSGTLAGVTGTYNEINVALDAMLAEKLAAVVDVVILDENGELKTVQKSVYDEDKIEELQSLANTIAGYANDNLGDKYNDYVKAVNDYKTEIDKLEAVPVYLDGWNDIIAHLNENAGDTITIADSGTMTAYFNAVYTGFNPDAIYSQGGQSINSIFSTKAMYDSFGLTAKQGQTQYNTLITNLYNELHAASFVPAQVTSAGMDATAKLSQGSQVAYDPIQLNGRAKVQGISKYSPASVTAATNLVTSVIGTKVTLWDTDPSVTGYNNNAGTVVDGTLADEIWAAVGLTSDSGAKDYDGEDRDERYLLVEGGQFVDALNDAIEYAKGELYEDDGETVKQFEVVTGDGTVNTDAIFTDESVEQLVAALEAAVVTDATTQAEIDQMVFDILENTDIANTIFLLAEDGTFYGTLNNVAEDEGLKYKPADYTYLDEELATAFTGESDGANAIIEMIWIDNGDGTFALDNPNGSKYFTTDTWTPYYTNYINALNPNIISRELTAKDQAKINEYTMGIYETRNALTWNGIDDNTWSQIDDLAGKIGSLESETVEVLTFINSKVQVLEDGTRVLTAPDIGSKSLSKYGDVSHIISLWATFSANYLEAEGIDITKQAEMLEKLQEIRDIVNALETKRFDTDESNEFTEGVRNLIDNFIAGTYTFNGLSSSNGVGTYVADYQTVANGTNVNAYEQLVRDEQRIFIQSKLNALYTIIGSGMEVGDQYQDHSTGSLIIYTTAIEAVNAIATELYEYLTNTPAQYAGFGLDLRQDMYDYLSTEIVVEVDYRYANTSPLYTKSIPLFNPEKLEEAKANIDGTGEDGNFGEFGNADGWPTINQLDTSVGLELTENTAVEDLTFQQPVGYDEETGETYYEEVYVNSNAISFVNGYSYIYSDAHGAVNYHNTAALDWLVNEVVIDTGDGIYILADTNGTKEIDEAVFHYTMDAAARRDGDWYTKDYGTDLNQDGTRYYLASHPENVVTGSSYNGWFTDATYEAVMQQRDDSAAYIDYSGYTFGSGPVAFAKRESIENSPTQYGVCWNEANRTAYLNAINEDQGNVDAAASSMYEKLCLLQLLDATDAYRYVAGLIYDALGMIPTYSEDNTTDIIIPEEENNGVGTLESNEEIGGRLFNIDLLGDLSEYTTVEDENGNVIAYYSTQLPSSYNGGSGAVKAILNILDEEIKKGKLTIDKADDILADNNSLKAMIIAELEKLGLGKADLSQITSLTKAFLANNPTIAESLGSYDIADEDIGTQFFRTTHNALGTTGNAKGYRGNDIMVQAGNVYHASGFYDFTKYKQETLDAVIEFLRNNDIITVATQTAAMGYKNDAANGFKIAFDAEKNGGELYDTPATQQEMVDNIYNELVEIINAMELQDATTTTLKEDIASADNIMLSEDIYDHEAVNNAGNNIWDEFIAALEKANKYKDVTIINQDQVLQAEDELEKAIKALVLYVDTFAPVVTVHNTQSDMSKFYKEHESELANTIASADQMVTASYMEAGLGGYTLYVYTNKLNPHIVVSLKDTTNVLNTDGSTRTVTASKPEKMSVSAQAMNGVSANVITPVLDAKTGTPLSSVSTKLTGATTMTAQTAKNAEGTYDADSSAYIILNPQFSDTDGVQQAAAYTISATDSAVTKDKESGEISEKVNGAKNFNYANNTELNETTEEGKITVFVYYMNSMPADGDDSGTAADASTILTYPENKGLAADEWTSTYGLLRKFNSAVRNWEFSDINQDLNEGAVYIDPTFGENNFGSFIYKLDPTATEGLDYDIANIYFKEGADAAKAAFISALKSNTNYINALDAESKKADSTKYIAFGADENYDQHLAFIDNGTLLFAHVADRFGNVCNRIIEVKNYDQLAPVLTADGDGAATVTEPGGSGVAKVDLFKYMGTQGGSLYLDYQFGMLHIDDFTYVSEDNTFTIKAGAAAAGKLFTVAVTDKAGNVGSVPVTADENGEIVLTVVETFDNVAEYVANDTNVDVNAGEDLDIIEFVFNSNETIKLNYFEPSSIVKAGPDGNVFANKKNVPLNIVAKSEVEAIRLYNVATAAEEIWTADNATVTDNGNGTKTWTVKYNFAEGEYNYIATAKVDGDWETFGVDFDFEATTKSVTVKLTVAGIGKIRFGFNEGNYSNVPVMSQKSVPYGSVVTLESVQTEEGSDFYYWVNNGSNRIISAAEEYKFTAVTTMDLTAQFTTNECFNSDKKLVVYVNNAENVIENFELADGENYKVPAAPSLPDHVFKSWSMTKDEILASDEMMIVVRPVYSLVVKNTVALTEGNWTTTGAGVYESIDNERALVTISASATDNAGAAFLYWLDAETGDIASYNRTYSFHAIKDTELTPVYGDASAVVPAPVARISTIKYDDSAKKVNFYAERSIPAEYELIMTGVIVTKTASIGTDEAAFVLDAAGVGKGVSKSTAANGFYTGAVSATAGTTVYARAYVVYMNADGDIITSYSPIASYTA